MPGANQLPPGSEGAAALSLTYAFISLFCSCMLLWLTLVHRERLSYITLLAGSTAISTVASIAQQIHNVVLYEDIVREQFRRRISLSDNPELAIANGSSGADLVLYYIQYYLYNVQAMLVMFWAGELAQLVYGFGVNTQARQILRRIHLAGKAVSFLLPLITILMLRSPTIQSSYVGFILVADLPLMVSLAIGSGLICSILWRYIRTKKKITNWSLEYQQSRSQSQGVAGSSGSTLHGSGTVKTRNATTNRRNFHDRWLMVRFSVAFVILALFEVTNVLFQVQSVHNLKKDASLLEPDLSAERARSTFFFFLPGTTAGIFLFIVFGTTSNCRSKTCETFVPRRWRRYEPSTGWKLTWQGEDPPVPSSDVKSARVTTRSVDFESALSPIEDMELGAVPKSTVSYQNESMRSAAVAPTGRAPTSRFFEQHNRPSSDSLGRQDSSAAGRTSTYPDSHGSSQISHVEESHYLSRSDSDDALPILPIMPTNPN